MRLMRFVPFYLFVHETQKTYENYSSYASSSSVHSSYESYATRARFIGREEREDNQTPRTISITQCCLISFPQFPQSFPQGCGKSIRVFHRYDTLGRVYNSNHTVLFRALYAALRVDNWGNLRYYDTWV